MSNRLNRKPKEVARQCMEGCEQILNLKWREGTERTHKERQREGS